MTRKAILLVPLTCNDGSRVPQEVLDGIYEALFVLSGGHASVGTVRGAYRLKDGTKLSNGSHHTRRRDSMSAVNELMSQAERAARDADTWADLSNSLFNPLDGLVAKAYPTREAREAFVRTEEYRRIRQLVGEAMERSGLVQGATPKKSGRFVVRIPQSLHAALEREAASEGISLNQLVLAKLAVGLGRLTAQILEADREDT